MSADEVRKLTFPAGRRVSEGGFLGQLRTVALVTVLAGAAGSLALLLRAGAGAPTILLVLFVGWVLSPFVGLVLASRISMRWSAAAGETLYCAMLVITLISLAIYGTVVLRAPGSRHTQVFLLVPLGSWLFTTIVVSTTALLSTRLSRRGRG